MFYKFSSATSNFQIVHATARPGRLTAAGPGPDRTRDAESFRNIFSSQLGLKTEGRDDSRLQCVLFPQNISLERPLAGWVRDGRQFLSSGLET